MAEDVDLFVEADQDATNNSIIPDVGEKKRNTDNNNLRDGVPSSFHTESISSICPRLGLQLSEILAANFDTAIPEASNVLYTLNNSPGQPGNERWTPWCESVIDHHSSEFCLPC